MPAINTKDTPETVNPDSSEVDTTPPEPIKVNNANQTELKNAVDDHIKKYLTKSVQFNQSHIHTDIKLALGYISCIFAAIASYYGYVNSFEDSKFVTFICVAVYFILNTISTLYGIFVEKDTLFIGSRASGESLQIDSNAKRYSDKYALTFYRVKSASKTAERKPASHKIVKSYGRWFYEDGSLAEEALEKDIMTGLEAIGIKVEHTH